jgi:hypothetical protein
MWVAIDLAFLALFDVLALVHLARRRGSMEQRDVVKWALLIVLLPFIGVVGYVFWRLDNAVRRGTPDRRDEAAPFLRSNRDDR